ncbi:VOC family protein [Pseudaestuariivita atlantica]|uniref:Glyoxalase n=1 Tax=Pseudaestuariivita atlantica TaxID=1317121 RepID=A0A0L1JRF9_9RHOB|nr:VOC family protein [Pseudaestuariivita atlantica]KNG94335.1 glyoxalase [Pseudaestuariivita atlantica]
MPAHLEHINITVSNIDRTIGMLTDLFGWSVRWRGTNSAGDAAAHVGDTDCYIALFELGHPGNPKPEKYTIAGTVNHVGVVVDDLDAVEARVRAAGLKPHAHFDYEPGKRFYFNDPDGVEYEVVSYA